MVFDDELFVKDLLSQIEDPSDPKSVDEAIDKAIREAIPKASKPPHEIINLLELAFTNLTDEEYLKKYGFKTYEDMMWLGDVFVDIGYDQVKENVKQYFNSMTH